MQTGTHCVTLRCWLSLAVAFPKQKHIERIKSLKPAGQVLEQVLEQLRARAQELLVK